MTTPSGTISVQDVANEFGLSFPVTFSQFYGLGGAPGSGPISLYDMRNRSNVSFSPAEGTHNVQAQGTAYFNASCNVDAVWTYTKSTTVNINIGPSGSTGRSVLVSLAAPRGQTREGSITLTATANGRSRTWTVYLTAWGDDLSGPI